jgi:putative ABC transport system permease protein
MRQILMWLKGTVHHRLGDLMGVVIGVALTVAFITVLGTFLVTSNAQMTQRASKDVPVDWQVQLTSSADASAVKKQIQQNVKPSIIEKVSYADVKGFAASSGGTVQTTGTGQAVGISQKYFSQFPAEVRLLLGRQQGVILAQQTAANLHVTIGSQVRIERMGLAPMNVTVDGIVDLPNADSLFQKVGIPAGAAPQAPPDNVVILPQQLWEKYFQPQQIIRPDSVRTQFHLRLGHPLPNNPIAAYTDVTHQANNLEARIAGSGIVGNNLGQRLQSVTEDSLYAQVLFLFLGLPGVILVISLTLAIANSAQPRRAREQALLRARGSSPRQMMRLVTSEAVLTGACGTVIGLVIALVFFPLLGISIQQIQNGQVLTWSAIAVLAGMGLALGAVIFPAWLLARGTTVAATRAIMRVFQTPLWQRMGLDIILLLIAAVEFWRTASSGYQVVLAPEGVAGSAVNYEAFIAPLCLWVGSILLSFRLLNGSLARGRRFLNWLIKPLTRSLSGLVARSLSRQRVLITRGIILVALAISFAVSTSIFDTIYTAQSRVDAELTNGADVTVTGPTASPPSTKLVALRAIPGVAAAQIMQHRFAYVGNDLQDIYGIDALKIGQASNMSDAFFGNNNAQVTLASLARTPDGVLVSQETINDFQLQPGDLLNLRVQSARDHQYHKVPFHLVGEVREFPTAPKDSFLVVNKSYLTQVTGSAAAEKVLLRVNGNLATVAAQARAQVRDIPGATVTDIGSIQQTISSSLTSVDLQGLSRMELAFAILLTAGATGLILGLGLAERRRMFAILKALGATDQQLGAFVWSEALLILMVGSLIGVLLGVGIAEVLVKMLKGVFDPPPQALVVPWNYLVLLMLTSVASTIAAVITISHSARRQVMETLRRL